MTEKIAKPEIIIHTPFHPFMVPSKGSISVTK